LSQRVTQPQPGVRYRFVDFVGADFEAIFRRVENVEDGHVRVSFDDHPPFTTNLPMECWTLPEEVPV
jgi:hypothetical protein